MPRQARLDIPGLLQHVIVRGIERRDVFRDDVDRHGFVKRLSELLVETDTDCFAWALIPNHFHLLLRPNSNTLKHFMRRLLTGYAIVFNKRHERSGHLFQNRYKSIVCEKDRYLLELVRYIHLNPLRAGLVNDLSELESFPWCGHRILLGRGTMPGQAVDEVLALFGKTRKEALAAYRRFVAAGVEQGERPELTGGGLKRSRAGQEAGEPQPFDDRVLGSGEFVDTLRRRGELRETMLANLSLEELLANVARYFAVEVETMRRRSRDRRQSMARAVFCALAVRRLRYSGAEAGRAIGIGRAAVTHAVRRGEVWLQANPGVEEAVLES